MSSFTSTPRKLSVVSDKKSLIEIEPMFLPEQLIHWSTEALKDHNLNTIHYNLTAGKGEITRLVFGFTSGYFCPAEGTYAFKPNKMITVPRGRHIDELVFELSGNPLGLTRLGLEESDKRKDVIE